MINIERCSIIINLIQLCLPYFVSTVINLISNSKYILLLFRWRTFIELRDDLYGGIKKLVGGRIVRNKLTGDE